MVLNKEKIDMLLQLVINYLQWHLVIEREKITSILHHTLLAQQGALRCLNHIQAAKVTISAHRTLNTVPCVISEDDLVDSSKEEILKEEMEVTPSLMEEDYCHSGAQNPPKNVAAIPSPVKVWDALEDEIEVTPSQAEGASSHEGSQDPPKK
ncbi:hypothetical protein HPB47_010357, partial [Ixodes persulcatus]